MDLIETTLNGCYEVQYRVFKDARGSFVKTYHYPQFKSCGLRTDWKEDYYSLSAKHALRGMHFQIPPADHAKLVHCISGEVLDVALDLRYGSPTFGQCQSFILSSKKGNSLYFPSGLAHGFLSLTDHSVMYYKVTSVHSSAHDAGVLWNSFGFKWPVENPILSVRDSQHPRFDNFKTPFQYQ